MWGQLHNMITPHGLLFNTSLLQTLADIMLQPDHPPHDFLMTKALFKHDIDPVLTFTFYSV